MAEYKCRGIQTKETDTDITMTFSGVNQKDAWIFMYRDFDFQGGHYPIRIAEIGGSLPLPHDRIAYAQGANPQDNVREGQEVGKAIYDGKILEVCISKKLLI